MTITRRSRHTGLVTDHVHNELSGGRFYGPVVQASHIDSVMFVTPAMAVPVGVVAHERWVEGGLGGVGPVRDGLLTGRLPLVRDFTDWDALGVHRPFTVFADRTDRSADVDAGVLPSYVPRDKDEIELRPHLRAMAGPRPPVNTRLIVVTGESSAGKTRMAVEAMRAELGEWRLLVPTGVHGMSQVSADHVNLRRTVVWLDEVQEFLGQPAGTELLRRLLTAPDGPTVLLGTIRADVDESLRDTSGWRLLDRLAVWIRLPRRFGDIELNAARELDTDPWIREALARMGDRHGLAEFLAAGPQLLREWTAYAIRIRLPRRSLRRPWTVIEPDTLTHFPHVCCVRRVSTMRTPGQALRPTCSPLLWTGHGN
jgi:hypothetical protein